MKKGLLLSIFAVLLIGGIVFAIWYINARGKMDSHGKNSFIPYNSAMIISVSGNTLLPAEIAETFADEIRQFQGKLLFKAVDTLVKRGYIGNTKLFALRVEGKRDLAFLYVMDNKAVLSRGETAEFLTQAFPGANDKVRKYDSHKIYSLKKNNEGIFYSIGDGVILVSNSELYIEDGLKQFDREIEGELPKSDFQNISKYFSSGAGISVFMNTSCFSDLLPLFLDIPKISANLDITKCFKWGTLDGDISGQGICLNGFMQYAGLDASYMRTLEGQQPLEANIDGIIPSHSASFVILNLSDLNTYFSALGQHHHDAGMKDKVTRRKQEMEKILGKGSEAEMNQLLQGEFALVNMSFDESSLKKEGLVIALLKSGGLCTNLVEKMLTYYAKNKGGDIQEYRKTYNIDRDKSFTYYRFPSEELPAVYWGYIFDGIEANYVLVEDNYLVFASSEDAVKNFIKDYTHRSFIKDAGWYKNMRTKLSQKYNLAYFSQIPQMFPFYKYIAKDDWKKYFTENHKKLTVFSTLALQWSNEGNMLYNTLLVSTEKIEDNVLPYILWQTKLDDRIGMKPVPVQNHITGEQELFVQDDSHIVYLVNDVGRVLWKQKVDGRINSEIYQVDALKNGKLQYLFSTLSKLYLIDRNGDAVGKFPVSFQSECTAGITMYDYDKDRNYRIFAPCADRYVYLYDLNGGRVKGWESEKADKEIVTKVQYYRVDDKDYIVYADQYRLYILDRKGKERVRVSSVFDLRNNTDIYLTKKGGVAMLAFTNTSGPVNLVDFKGNVQTIRCGKLSADYNMNVADVNGDGIDDYVLTDSERFFVYNSSGQLLYEKILEGYSLGFPYIYRFSNSDIRIGLIDKEQKHMLLLSPDGATSKGFPIAGDSPFSIVFSGTDGFFLFSGTNNGSLIKYRVQR